MADAAPARTEDAEPEPQPEPEPKSSRRAKSLKPRPQRADPPSPRITKASGYASARQPAPPHITKANIDASAREPALPRISKTGVDASAREPEPGRITRASVATSAGKPAAPRITKASSDASAHEPAPPRIAKGTVDATARQPAPPRITKGTVDATARQPAAPRITRAGVAATARSSTTATAASPYRDVRARLLVDGEHYSQLIARRVGEARVSVWISTANLKAMMVEAPVGTRARARGGYVSFFEGLADLAKRGVDVCILHASRPSGPLRRLGIGDGIKLRQCPRVHLKMIAIDGQSLYLGSANLTGAGLGAKGEGRRNFEMGILTDDPVMLDAAQERFDRIWRGRECAGCALRRECPAPLDLARAPARSKPRRT